MNALLNRLINIVAFFINIVKRVCVTVYEKFMDINIFEKGIVLATILAFAAVVLPMARYYMFEQYFTINNPIAHHMIGIAMIMLVTVYYHGVVSLIIRIAINGIYLCGIIYLAAAHEISKAPYEIAGGYYLNIIAPLIYMGLAAASVLLYREP